MKKLIFKKENKKWKMFKNTGRNTQLFLRDNLNAGGSATCIHKKLFLDGAVISHVITCQGRDHIVSIHSGDSILVIVKCPFRA